MKPMEMSAMAPVIVRLSMAGVILWFGISQIVDPESFIGYVPSFIPSELVIQSIIFNGILEVLFGGLLALGMLTRISAFLMTLHLVGITFSLGYNDVAIRDAGLTLATASIMLNGPDKWSLDKKLRSKKIIGKFVS